ncbi:hypothetical protein SAMN05216188_12344 [Lentzea xinjiangensis]|uniref:Uncharacterized protein n=1 Tax=Lentzea xinjiangensis TaxID=402600 RepID=A0A1H9UZ89_9PSEU|nr:hypothetical protein [Lentzea xinjiangensis]SES14669.1 hypothetical protein SAMN05216188_12344 [Lentzea xinjiangensis]
MFEPYLAAYHYYALFEDGRGMSDVGNAEDLYRRIAPHEEQEYTGHGVWVSSDGLSRAGERDSDDAYREVSATELERLGQLVDDRGPLREVRRDGFEGGGFAVFRHEADMVDLHSAYAVVDELLPEHRFALPLASFERDVLAGIVALLAARRRAEPVDGHYCFAAFERLGDVADLDRAHALIRCSSSGDGEWEIYLQEGVWVRGEQPRHDVVLPIGRDDLERTIRGRETAEARYFDVWHGFATEDGRYLHDLVRRTGSSDDTPDDLGWRHTDVLTRLEPGWWVVELGERNFRGARYVAALTERSRRFHGQPHDYRAVFRKDDRVYSNVCDLGNVLFLAKRLPNPYELEYELWTPDGWQPTSTMLLEYTTLPISEEEFQRLAAPRQDEPGVDDLGR